MSRTNYFKLVEEIYRIRPTIGDKQLAFHLGQFVEFVPSRSTVASWKSRLRKMGIPIPDERKKK